MIKNKYYKIGNLKTKLALITDIHFDIDYNLNIFNDILENIKVNEPNFICITGDIIDNMHVISNDKIEYLKQFIINLSKIGSVIICLGNHDISSYKHKEYNETLVNEWFLNFTKLENVYYLNNKSLVRDNICFTGINLSEEYYRNKEKNNIFAKELDEKINLNKKYYNVLLCHSPINILKKDTLQKSKQIKKVNLVLSGHMHNGLVLDMFDGKGNFGLVGPYYTLFPKMARNIVKKIIDNHEINLVICGGIVKISNTNSKIFKPLNKLYPIHIDYIDI